MTCGQQTSLAIAQEENNLYATVETVLKEAKRLGATACEVGASVDTGLSATARMGEVDTVEFSRDRGISVTVYFDQRKGSASSSDDTAEAVRETVKAACHIARYTSEDPFSGLAGSDQMATQSPDLDLYHPWDITAEQAIEKALACESAALSASDKIVNSEGATLNTHHGSRIYGNSHGFVGTHRSSSHSVVCSVIARDKDEMQGDYWYSVARRNDQLDDLTAIGQQAARRALGKLGSRQIPTAKVPVLLSADIASGLVGSLMSAISGASLYREASFLLNRRGQQIFPEWVSIYERPQLPGAMGSAAFDGDGLQTRNNAFITDGILENYLLSTYSARKLGMTSTANAGGARNIFLDSNGGDLDALIAQMDKGLLITDLIGHGVNIVTGDYSRGASGFWVENGEIQFPVSEVTVAGNLKNMFANIRSVGNDVDRRKNIQTGSILIDDMMVAGS